MSSSPSPVCSVQQSPGINFSGIWCPNPNTSINVTGGKITITGDTKYDTSGRTRGFAPMILINIPQATGFCISFDIQLNMKNTIFQRCIGGVMFLSSMYLPIFECGIGKWVSPPSDEIVPYSNIPAPASPVFTLIDDEPSTIITSYFQNFSDDDISTTPGDVSIYDSSEIIHVKVTYNNSTRNLQFFDGIKTVSSSLLDSVTYIALYMRGVDKNSAVFSNLVYGPGLTDATIPTIANTLSDAITLTKTDTFDNILLEGTSTLQTCADMCKLDSKCKSFSFETTENLCSLKTSFDISKLKNQIYPKQTVLDPTGTEPTQLPASTLSTTNLYIPKLKTPIVSFCYAFSPSLSISSSISIDFLSIDNTSNRSDFCAYNRTTDVTYIGQFGYDVIEYESSSTGTLVFELSISQNILYLMTYPGYNFFKIQILNSSFTNIARDIFSITTDTMFPLDSTAYDFKLTGLVETQSGDVYASDDINYFSLSKNASTITVNQVKSNNLIIPISPSTIQYYPSKIVLTTSPYTSFMMLIPGVYVLLDNSSVFSTAGVIKGEKFSRIQPQNLRSYIGTFSYTPTASTDSISGIIPITISSQVFGTYVTEEGPLFAINIFGSSIQFLINGYSSLYPYIINSNGTISYTDSTNNRNIIYLSSSDGRLYNRSDSGKIIGPFIRTFPYDFVGCTCRAVPNIPFLNLQNKYLVREITLETFRTIRIIDFIGSNAVQYQYNNIEYNTREVISEYVYNVIYDSTQTSSGFTVQNNIGTILKFDPTPWFYRSFGAVARLTNSITESYNITGLGPTTITYTTFDFYTARYYANIFRSSNGAEIQFSPSLIMLKPSRLLGKTWHAERSDDDIVYTMYETRLIVNDTQETFVHDIRAPNIIKSLSDNVIYTII